MLDRLEMPRVTGLGGRLSWSRTKIDIPVAPPSATANPAEAGADSLLGKLEELRADRSTDWAMKRDWVLPIALRFYRMASTKPGGETYERNLIKANLCEYGLGLFSEWEKSSDRLELTTPRESLLGQIARVVPRHIDP